MLWLDIATDLSMNKTEHTINSLFPFQLAHFLCMFILHRNDLRAMPCQLSTIAFAICDYINAYYTFFPSETKWDVIETAKNAVEY